MGSVEKTTNGAPAQPTLLDLAAEVTKLAGTLTSYLQENKLPVPTLAADSPTSYDGLSPEMWMTRQHLLDKLADMAILTQGPSESVFNYAHSCMPDAAALNVLNHFDFWSAVPLKGSASHASIAAHTSLPEEVVERVLRHALTLRFFAPSPESPKHVQHSSRSAALAQSSGLRALVSTVMDDAGAPMLVLQEALERYSAGKPALTQKVDETSFAVLHRKGGGDAGYKNSWEMLENDGEGDKKGWRAREFVEFMRYLKEIFRFEEVVRNAFDWASLGEARVVDVGGSAGHDAVVLAKAFPNLSITVQDLPKVHPVFDADVPADMKTRVSFLEHNFFNPQPVQGDVYILKMILHDWTDAEAAQILRSLVPALKPGARVILVEYIGNRDGGEEDAKAKEEKEKLPRSVTQMGTATDLRLMALFNAKERPVDAWGKLFKTADERFQLGSVKAGPHDFFAVVEAVWRP